MKDCVKFYREGDDFGCFSNFSRHPIELDGKTWPTTEHYFQAMKFVGTPHEEAVRQADGPGESARMGRDRARPLRPDWETVKDGIMEKACYAKFTQHADIRKVLLSTGDAKLIEHTRNDSYWGDGGDGTGRNMLGITLMNVRAILRSEAEATKAAASGK
eukprot:TRINITY_DN5121_c0_g1_i2.p1 TRINITY_DN5121_c0_g1~~TRINITY_DN5121_c0_g1_i2.p1  ORF type:complete len:159 (+),score=36.25 TRINITY_DN5121_c0_g1_i2:93-569(+)